MQHPDLGLILQAPVGVQVEHQLPVLRGEWDDEGVYFYQVQRMSILFFTLNGIFTFDSLYLFLIRWPS